MIRFQPSLPAVGFRADAWNFNGSTVVTVPYSGALPGFEDDPHNRYDEQGCFVDVVADGVMGRALRSYLPVVPYPSALSTNRSDERRAEFVIPVVPQLGDELYLGFHEYVPIGAIAAPGFQVKTAGLEDHPSFYLAGVGGTWFLGFDTASDFFNLGVAVGGWQRIVVGMRMSPTAGQLAAWIDGTNVLPWSNYHVGLAPPYSGSTMYASTPSYIKMGAYKHTSGVQGVTVDGRYANIVVATTLAGADPTASGGDPGGVVDPGGGGTPSVAAPLISPTSGSYDTGVTVTIIAVTGLAVYYTTDGTTPTTSSAAYTGDPITLTPPATVRAVAADGSGNLSAVVTVNYVPSATPTDPSGGDPYVDTSIYDNELPMPDEPPLIPAGGTYGGIVARNRFTNPNNGFSYDWHINHQEEDEYGRGRSVDFTASTSGVGGLVVQQGVDDPIVLSYKGTILDPNQHAAFVAWSNLCRSQTIVFRDFNGDEYEVLMTYKANRERVLVNPHGGTLAPNHIWRYTMTMQVIHVIAGYWNLG